MAIGAQAVGHQMSGDYVQGIRFLEKTLSAYTWLPRDRSQLLLYRAFLCLLEGNLPAGVLSVRDCLRVDAGSRAWHTIGPAFYVAGICHYLRNEPEAAQVHLQVMVDNRAFVDSSYLAHSTCALLRIYRARAEFEKAGELLQRVKSHLQLSDDAWSLEVLRGFEVELALDLGDIEAAQRLALTVNFVDYRDIWFWYLLQLTPIKLLLAQSGAEDLARARTLLDELDAHVHAIHRHSARIDVLSLLALVAEAQGDTTAALDKLTEALALAEPGGIIRSFVDLGRPMADLLIGLRQGNGIAPSLLAHVDRILALFPATNSTGVPLTSTHAERPTIRAVRFPSKKLLAKPLTKREQQILTRLNSEQSPDEIARDLSVSTATVRSHIKRVYAKLDVHSRYEAVDRARELGLL